MPDFIDPNDRAAPRPCPSGVGDPHTFTPKAAGRLNDFTTCGRESCRKAVQRARAAEIMAGLDALNTLYVMTYGEPLEPPMTARKGTKGRDAEPAASRIDMHAEDVLRPGLVRVLATEFGVDVSDYLLDVEEDENGVVGLIGTAPGVAARPQLSQRSSGTYDPAKRDGQLTGSRRSELPRLRDLARSSADRVAVDAWLASGPELGDLPPLIR